MDFESVRLAEQKTSFKKMCFPSAEENLERHLESKWPAERYLQSLHPANLQCLVGYFSEDMIAYSLLP